MALIKVRTCWRSRSLAWALLPAGCIAWVLATDIAAQQHPPEAPPTLSIGTANLVLEGRPVATVPTAQTVDGPRFALAPIASVLGVELRIGPLGDSHTLIFDDRQIIMGPGQSTLLTVAPDGRTERDATPLARMPIRDGQGLKVPLEVLEIAIGEPLNYRFAWNAEQRLLDVARPEARLLHGTVNLRSQYQVTLVEIELSAEPRYRVERSPDALEIQLIGDRLEASPIRPSREPDPIVRRVTVAPDRLRLELAPGAVAAEPRLLLQPRVLLVVEVFQGANAPQTVTGDEAPRRSRRRDYTIVLDPGHGGSETGAVGAGGTAEADLTLLIAKALRIELRRRLRVEVVMTRTENVDIPLESRTAIANENQADLFISLHLNSSFGSSPRGAETYFLSREASDQQAAALAAAENATAPGDANPELELQMILWDLAQSYHLAKSQRFASLVQEELNLALGLRDRGVKQAPFTVLMGAKMPAVLVELGFLSNPEEEERLQSPVYRAELVDALVQAVSRFKRQIEERDLSAQSSDRSDVPGASADGKGSS